MIHTFIPFDPTGGKNLGESYNLSMSILPNDNDWACFIDHDAIWTTVDWHNQLMEVIKNNPNIYCFTAMTNRLPDGLSIKLQTIGDKTNHDMKYHRKFGMDLSKKYGSTIIEYNEGFMSGVVILVKKSLWKKIKFTDGLYGVDYIFHKNCLKNGYKIGLMKGVYVYHWCREKI